MGHLETYSGCEDDIGRGISGKSHIEVIANLRQQLREATKFLRKYQARYHGAVHAQKLWQSVDTWLKENQP
jgi:hypothetical protein